jgi:hypothetical protein
LGDKEGEARSGAAAETCGVGIRRFGHGKVGREFEF